MAAPPPQKSFYIKANAKKKKKQTMDKVLEKGIVPVSGLVKYSGPIKSPVDSQNTRVETVLLHLSTTITLSTSASFYTPVFSAIPSGATNWSNFAALWDEYRLLGFEIEYMPLDQYTLVNGSTNGNLLLVVDHTDTTSLTNATDACKYESVRQVSLRKPWRQEWKMNGIEEAVWVDCASPAAFGAIKASSTAAGTSSATVGTILYTYRVQFRGTGL
jgi:hypothetical protein